MQTFLPYPSYEESAKVLDRQRLGKQRVECLQILRALLGESSAWVNHPAVQMWRGYEGSLCLYTEHYRQYFDVPDDIPYFWPTKEGY